MLEPLYLNPTVKQYLALNPNPTLGYGGGVYHG